MNIDWHLLFSEVSEKLDTSGIDENTANQRQSQYGKTRLSIKKEHCFTDDPSSIV
jgi:hypothetical protein